MLKHALALVLLVSACGAPPPPTPLQPAPAPAPSFEFPFTSVWTSRPGVVLQHDSITDVTVSRLFSRLEVLDADSTGVLARCSSCPGIVEGRTGWDGIVFDPGQPAAASHGLLAEFALAVRRSAEARDIEALRRIMARDFSYALTGPQGREAALVVWEAEGFSSLDQVPRLLDGGLATRDGTLWAAPAAHLEEFDYRGYRLGFRATPDGRWEWVFLMRSERP
jgi:hypothetical protein